MKKARKLSALLLTLVMVFSLSATAFAATPGEVTVIVKANDAQIDTFPYDVGTNTNVYNVVSGNYGTNADWSGSYLQGITIGSVNYATNPYTPAAGAFDEWGEYVEDVDDELEKLNAKPEFAQYGGIYMDASDMLGEGYFFLADMQHMCYVGNDWTYQVDYAADGYGNPVTPGEYRPGLGYDDDFYQYTMDECVLSDGDVVYLTYGLTHIIFQ